MNSYEVEVRILGTVDGILVLQLSWRVVKKMRLVVRLFVLCFPPILVSGLLTSGVVQ